jgi:hypothetical protein
MPLPRSARSRLALLRRDVQLEAAGRGRLMTFFWSRLAFMRLNTSTMLALMCGMGMSGRAAWILAVS